MPAHPKTTDTQIIQAARRVVEIEGPHMLLQTRATECAHELQTFIQQLEPVGIPARGFCP